MMNKDREYLHQATTTEEILCLRASTSSRAFANWGKNADGLITPSLGMLLWEDPPPGMEDTPARPATPPANPPISTLHHATPRAPTT
jgi:hypothetical protein